MIFYFAYTHVTCKPSPDCWDCCI